MPIYLAGSCFHCAFSTTGWALQRVKRRGDVQERTRPPRRRCHLDFANTKW